MLNADAQACGPPQPAAEGPWPAGSGELRCSDVEGAVEVVEVLAEQPQCRSWPLAAGGAVVGPLQCSDGHVGQLVADGVGTVAAGPEPPGDPVAHADHGQRGDPGVDGPEPARAYPLLDDTGDGLQDGPAAGVVGVRGFRREFRLGADEQEATPWLGRLPDG